ncbi:helicase PIF1 [Seminavis robusta]|uniref:ATP-dependent DNA helicase n=1 Tax=Seminavis robusta TaxID=568900 RepID=A0A9N8HTW9_9STRA|nr:helicase PIF1 [Seminavis robusta]|eukprot:Sro1324_g262830.1 helicase PIF1 (138) ;mRNA; r:28168-28581
MAYGKEFCSLIDNPFNDRTIVGTAMSGVAATILHGETTHPAVGLNRTRESVAKNLVEEWSDARMLIFDEISFAGELDLVKKFHYTKTLMQDEYQPFGVLNLVFAGDYSQLEPVGRPAIYNLQHTIPEFHDSLNSLLS